MVRKVSFAFLALLSLPLVSLVYGHDSTAGNNVAMEWANVPSAALATTPTGSATMATSSAIPESYFTLSAQSGLMTAHILLMTFAWIFVLPIGAQSMIALIPTDD